MRLLPTVAIAVFAVLACRPAVAQYYDGDAYADRSATVQCSSYDDSTNRCPIDGGQVVLLRQHSRAECVKGRSWGSNEREIWVSRGCRATFRVIGDDYGGGGHWNDRPSGSELIRCESNDGDYRRCRLPGPGRVRLVRQLSRAACIEGRSWGSDYGRLWVSDGCRGEFSVAFGHGSWGGGDAREFRCESVCGHYTECAADIRRGVELVRQLSRTDCRRGETWGYGRRGVWVDGGCRAVFRSF